MTIQCGGELLKTPGGTSSGTVHVLSTIETDRNGRDMTPPRFSSLKPEDVETPNFFRPVADRLAQSHVIRVYLRNPAGGYFRATFEVVHADRNCVMVEREGDWVAKQPRWSGDFEVRQAANGKYEVVDLLNNAAIIYTGPSLADANNFMVVHKMRLGAGEPGNAPPPPVAKPPAEMSIAELQAEHKRLTGSGFRPGTSKDEMVAALTAAQAKAA